MMHESLTQSDSGIQSVERVSTPELSLRPHAVAIKVINEGPDIQSGLDTSLITKETLQKGTMNILVTGGAGYIGSIVTAQLVETGHTVTVLDNLVRGHRQAVHPDATFIRGDVSDKHLVEDVLKKSKIDAVMHFAAFIEAGESMKQPEKYFRNNTINTISLLESMLHQGVSRFVFSSTAAVYGEPKAIPITEDSDLVPTNAYGASKKLIEDTLEWYNRIHGFKYAALRYFNACGATDTLGEDHQPETHLIPLAMQAALGKRPSLQLYGTDYPTRDGTCIRDYIHVTDLAAAHLLALVALDTKKSGRLIYNLGSEEGFSNREVLETIGKVTGLTVPYTDAPRRSGDPAVLIASSANIRRELGWERQYKKLEDIITTVWDWRQKHPDGYSDKS